MMLYETLKHKYPDLEDIQDYLLFNDGTSTYIAEWRNQTIAEPTMAELTTYWEQNQTSISDMFKPQPSVEETQADLIYTLMMNGVI